jgi:hypothetical protein
MAIASEMGRVYRSTINGLISTSDGARLIYQLKEIRGVREAVNAEAALAAAKEAAKAATEPAPFTVNIVSVPEGFYKQPDGTFSPDAPGRLIEHIPCEPVTRAQPLEEFEPRTERERRLLAELEALSPEELLERARQAGYVDADGV